MKSVGSISLFVLIVSLPSRECGLKSLSIDYKGHFEIVTPFAGVWIEIANRYQVVIEHDVTPFAGVWIEISLRLAILFFASSLPSRECGLKSDGQRAELIDGQSHSLRGSVD